MIRRTVRPETLYPSAHLAFNWADVNIGLRLDRESSTFWERGAVVCTFPGAFSAAILLSDLKLLIIIIVIVKNNGLFEITVKQLVQFKI